MEELRDTENKTRRSILVVVAWLLPAVLGAVLDWPGRVILALLIPGLILYVVSEGMQYYKDTSSFQPRSPLAKRLPILYMLPPLVIAIIYPSRVSGLLVVAGFVYTGFWLGGRSSKGRAIHHL